MSNIRQWDDSELEIMRTAAQAPGTVIAERFDIPEAQLNACALDAVQNFARLAVNGGLPIMDDQSVNDLLAMAYNDAISEASYMIHSID